MLSAIVIIINSNNLPIGMIGSETQKTDLFLVPQFVIPQHYKSLICPSNNDHLLCENENGGLAKERKYPEMFMLHSSFKTKPTFQQITGRLNITAKFIYFFFPLNLPFV